MDEKPRVLASVESTPLHKPPTLTRQNTSQRIGRGLFIVGNLKEDWDFLSFQELLQFGPCNKQHTPVQQNRHSQRVTEEPSQKNQKEQMMSTED